MRAWGASWQVLFQPAPLSRIPLADAPANRWFHRLGGRGLPRLQQLFRQLRRSVRGRWSVHWCSVHHSLNQKADTVAVRERATVPKERHGAALTLPTHRWCWLTHRWCWPMLRWLRWTMLRSLRRFVPAHKRGIPGPPANSRARNRDRSSTTYTYSKPKALPDLSGTHPT